MQYYQNRRRTTSQLGIATLEAAILMMVFLSAVMSGAALFSYTSDSRTLQKIIHRNLHDIKELPVRLAQDGKLNPELDEALIQSRLDQVLSNTEQELVRLLLGTNAGSDSFKLEVAYSVIRIHSGTGQSLGFLGSPIRWRRSVGHLNTQAANEFNFEQAIEGFESRKKDNDSQLFAVQVTGGTFVPWIVLVGIRASIERKDGVVEWFFTHSGQDAVLSNGKISVLRGGVRL